MTPRAVAGIAVAVLAAIVLCAGGIGALFVGTGDGATCLPSPGSSASPAPAPSLVSPGPGGRWPAIGRWDSEQVGHAATIVAVGTRMGVPARGWVIAVATVIQESDLRNLPGGPDDSIGLFQQRPSQGWGTPAQLADPTYAATKFYEQLLKVPNWQAMALTDAAQAVQRSAYPDAYADDEPAASMLVAAISGLSGALGDCTVAVGPQGWVQPVRAPVVSGFRTASRPAHHGVDLGAARGTPIHAASSGVVSRVRCNAIRASDGSDWGCDRDGDPILTRGCDQLTAPSYPPCPSGAGPCYGGGVHGGHPDAVDGGQAGPAPAW